MFTRPSQGGGLSNVQPELVADQQSRVEQLLELLASRGGIYGDSPMSCREAHPREFEQLGERLCEWAEKTLGEEYLEAMVDGYCRFVGEVNLSQARYQRRGRYRHSSFAEVYTAVYDNPDFMGDYHWGVFTTTFAWEHHLKLHGLFEREFISRASKAQAKRLLDLGSGSGVWSFLSATSLPGVETLGVDISETSATASAEMAQAIGLSNRCRFTRGDALVNRDEGLFDAGVSCFLLEHLEEPRALMEALASQLKPGAPAFVTGALTASEADHIFEFRRESELLRLAEEAGFRVIVSMSLGPEGYPERARFLPRSMAMVLEKRRGEWW